MSAPADTRLRVAFAWQAEACSDLGSPFMGQLCRVLADRLSPGTPLTDRLFDWPGDLTPRAESVPLRLCGALHALRLQNNERLDAVYPPAEVSDDQLWEALSDVLTQEADFIDDFINSAPQTNEVRRQAAILTAGHYLTGIQNLPIQTFELGASAGLNLKWDRAAMVTDQGQLGSGDPILTLRPDWTGPLPQTPAPRIKAAHGVDLNPLSPARDGLRLRAYLWPDQPHRLTLTDAAIAHADTPVDQADAIDWLEDHLTPVPGHWRMIYSTVAWQYFPAQSQARGTKMIEQAGAAATDDTPLAWFQMEADDQIPGAAMTLRLWPGDRHVTLGRVDFHGRWLNYAPQTH